MYKAFVQCLGFVMIFINVNIVILFGHIYIFSLLSRSKLDACLPPNEVDDDVS